MLPSKKRLSRIQFEAFASFKEQKVVFNRLGTLKYKESNEMLCSVVTSSKHEKRAVVRNKLRRRIYFLFGQNPLSLVMVLYVSKQSYTMEYSDIKILFHELIQKIQKHS
jgi:ribonuclease P protein component